MTKKERSEKMRLLVYDFLKKLEEYKKAGADVRYDGDEFDSVYFDEDDEEYGIRLDSNCKIVFWENGDEEGYKSLRKSLCAEDIVVIVYVNKKKKLYKMLKAKDIIEEVEKEMRK